MVVVVVLKVVVVMVVVVVVSVINVFIYIMILLVMVVVVIVIMMRTIDDNEYMDYDNDDLPCHLPSSSVPPLKASTIFSPLYTLPHLLFHSSTSVFLPPSFFIPCLPSHMLFNPAFPCPRARADTHTQHTNLILCPYTTTPTHLSHTHLFVLQVPHPSLLIFVTLYTTRHSSALDEMH